MTRIRTRALPLLAAALLALLALAQSGGAPTARADSPAAAEADLLTAEADSPAAGAGSPAAAEAGSPDSGADSAVAAGTFANPIVTQNGADPTIIRYAGYYYHLGTTWASHWEMRRSPTLGGL